MLARTSAGCRRSAGVFSSSRSQSACTEWGLYSRKGREQVSEVCKKNHKRPLSLSVHPRCLLSRLLCPALRICSRAWLCFCHCCYARQRTEACCVFPNSLHHPRPVDGCVLCAAFGSCAIVLETMDQGCFVHKAGLSAAVKRVR